MVNCGPLTVDRAVEVDVSPRLMFVFSSMLTPEAIERIREEVGRALAEGKPLIVEQADVYQLIDGVWSKLQ